MRHFLLIVGLLGGGVPLLAQTEPEAPLPSFEESVIVSATLDSEEREDVPASVTVVTEEEIEDRQAVDLPELLSTVPGLSVVQAGSPGQQTSVFTRGSDSHHTLLLWNGIPLNDPYFGDVNWQFVSLDGVERVEVVRGPFSALYGSNAVGGVVQVFTGTRQGGSLNLEGGENGYLRGGLAAGTDLGSVRLDVTGHVRRGEGELENDFYDGEEAVARALWTVTPGVSVGLLARANDAETGIPLSGGEPTLNRRITWDEAEVAVPFRLERGSWEVEAQVSETQFDATFQDPDSAFGAIDNATDSEALRGRAVATWRAGQDFWLAFGGDWERVEVTSTSSGVPNLEGARQRTWAAFAQGSWGRGPFRGELGLRRDDNDVFGAETSLRAGAVLSLSGSTRLRASYGEAFRAPSLGELYFPFFGNPDLQPETGESWELGLEHEAGGWRFALTGFENRQRNLIDFDPVTFVSINIGRARSRGIEGEVGVKRGIFGAALTGTYLEAEDLDTGLKLLRRPEESATLLLTAKPGDWTFNIESRYVGDRPDLDEVTFSRRENPAYTRVDIAARWRALSWLAPYARVENVTDEEYEAVLRYPAPGRTLIGGVALEF
jgi:vitamin B12 transporter